MNKERIKTFTQGAAVGAIVLTVGMFWSGFAVTSGSAESMATTEARLAVVDHLAPICAAQFSLAENSIQLRKDLAAKQSWDQGEFVKAKGWATMPGSTAPRDDIARACAELILKPGV